MVLVFFLFLKDLVYKFVMFLVLEIGNGNLFLDEF